MVHLSEIISFCFSGKRGGDNRPANMVEALMRVQKALHPWKELVAFAVEFNAPIYAMMAATEPTVSRTLCLAIILATSLPDSDILRLRQDLNLIGASQKFAEPEKD